jgi:hypothetical protein
MADSCTLDIGRANPRSESRFLFLRLGDLSGRERLQAAVDAHRCGLGEGRSRR